MKSGFRYLGQATSIHWRNVEAALLDSTGHVSITCHVQRGFVPSSIRPHIPPSVLLALSVIPDIADLLRLRVFHHFSLSFCASASVD